MHVYISNVKRYRYNILGSNLLVKDGKLNGTNKRSYLFDHNNDKAITEEGDVYYGVIDDRKRVIRPT